LTLLVDPVQKEYSVEIAVLDWASWDAAWAFFFTGCFGIGNSGTPL